MSDASELGRRVPRPGKGRTHIGPETMREVGAVNHRVANAPSTGSLNRVATGTYADIVGPARANAYFDSVDRGVQGNAEMAAGRLQSLSEALGRQPVASLLLFADE